MFAHQGAPVSPPEYVTIAEAADALRCTDRFVRKLIAKGDLPAFKVGTKAIRLRRTDVEALLTPVAVDGGDAA